MRYTRKQKEIMKLLSKYDDVEEMYVGALQGYHTKNEDYFAQCGTSIREILDKLSKLNASHLKNDQENNQIKNTMYNNREKKQNDAATRILNFFDPQNTRIMDYAYRKCELIVIIDYFNKLVHHEKKTTRYKFNNNLRKFEDIIYDLLRPKTEIHNELKRILKIKRPNKNMLVKFKKIIFHNNTTVNYFFINADKKWFNILYDSKYMIKLNILQYTSIITYLTRMAKYYPIKVANVILKLSNTIELNNYHLNKIIKLFTNISSQKHDIVFINKMKDENWLIHLSLTDMKVIFDYLKNLIHKKSKKNVYELLDIIMEFNNNTYIISYTEKEIIKFIKIMLDKMLKKYPIQTIKYLLRKIKNSNIISKKNNHVDKFTNLIQYIPNHKLIHNRNLHSLFVMLSYEYIHKIKWKISTIKRLIKHLDALNMPIFKRLKILIYQKYTNTFKKQIRDIIINDFDDYALQYEYNHLLKSIFQKLNKCDKIIYFNRIKAGPALSEIIYYVKNTKREYICSQILNWKKKKLSHIEEFLNSAEKSKFKKIIDHNYTNGSEIYSKPISKERQYGELELGMPFDHVITHINNYDVDTEIKWQDNSPHIFSGIVSHNIVEYVKNMDKFLKVHDQFIISFFTGVIETTKHNEIEWNSIIKFCHKLLDNYKMKDRDDGIMVQILFCFHDALTNNKIKFNDDVWKLILKIYELDKSISNSNTISYYNPVEMFSSINKELEPINYVDGALFHIVLEYLIWHIENNNKKKEEEILEILNAYLENKSQYTIAKHRVLGEYFGYVFSINPKWANLSKLKIFGKIDNMYTIAAWAKYLEYNEYDKKVYSVLKSQYEKHSRYGIQCFRGSMIKHITTDYLLTTRSNSIFNLMICELIKKSSNENREDELPIQICTFEIKQLLEYYRHHKEPKLQLENLEKIWKNIHIADSVSLSSWIKFTPFEEEKTLRLCTNLFKTGKYYGKSFHVIHEIEKYFSKYPKLTAQCLYQFLKYADNLTREDPDMIKILLDKISKNKSLKTIHDDIENALKERKDWSDNYTNI